MEEFTIDGFFVLLRKEKNLFFAENKRMSMDPLFSTGDGSIDFKCDRENEREN
ncbi:MAG: hypothetical protein L7R83_06055 [Candidatus Poseidonia sp.]|nr:hypothetical protein [Poseidonia sp.]